MNKIKKAKINIRQVTKEDFAKIVTLSSKIYTEETGISIEMLTGQFNKFPEGQFVVNAKLPKEQKKGRLARGLH